MYLFHNFLLRFFFLHTHVFALSLYVLQSFTVHVNHKDNLRVVIEDLSLVVMTLTCMQTCLVSISNRKLSRGLRGVP
jgi:hypothetical protein